MPAITLAPPTRRTLQETGARGFAWYSTLPKKIASGELPAERVGRRYLILESDLEAMVAPVIGRPTEDASITAAIDRLIASAPQLSREQREHLADLLGGVQHARTDARRMVVLVPRDQGRQWPLPDARTAFPPRGRVCRSRVPDDHEARLEEHPKVRAHLSDAPTQRSFLLPRPHARGASRRQPQRR